MKMLQMQHKLCAQLMSKYIGIQQLFLQCHPDGLVVVSLTSNLQQQRSSTTSSFYHTFNNLQDQLQLQK